MDGWSVEVMAFRIWWQILISVRQDVLKDNRGNSAEQTVIVNVNFVGYAVGYKKGSGVAERDSRSSLLETILEQVIACDERKRVITQLYRSTDF